MNNPLRQYFRRPALHVRLPSAGKFYPQGSIDMPANGELPVYPMTAIDEITSKTPDALFNGSAIVDIIKSCVPAIKDPWVVPSIDLDALLIAIRTATNGNQFEINSKCPKCEEENVYSVNLVQLLAGIDPSGYDTPLMLGDLTITFKPIPYSEVNKGNLAQFEVQREIQILTAMEDETARNTKSSETMKKLTEMNMLLVADSIDRIELPNNTVVSEREFIVEYLHQCDKNSYETIRGHVVSLRTSTSTKPLQLKCGHCSNEYEQSIALNVSDFFG